MQRNSQFISEWTGSALIMLVFAAASIARASAQETPSGSSEPDAPSYSIAAFTDSTPPPSAQAGFNPTVHSFGYIDLSTDDLPPGLRPPVSHSQTGGDTSSDFRDLPNSPDTDSGSSSSSSAVVLSNPRKAPETEVRWKAAIRESLFLIGIGHTFDLTTEAGTRDATFNGPWLNDYLHSVGELRGWSDSDHFMAPYASHPIQGSAFGFIARQNDPRYRKVQWGDGREYFMSILHSMAWAAIWHAEWKIGPASEASIGNVMLHASPGFICLVDTPTLGAIAMMAEDAADRYLITGLENRTTNRLLIVLARSFLNPGRSTAQAMALRYPWDRDYRLRLTGEEYQLRKQLVAEYKAGGEKPFVYTKPQGPVFEKEYPKEADIELTAFPVYERFLGGKGPNNCIGGGGSGASRLNPYFQAVGEVSGCLIMGMPAVNQSGDMLFWGGGLRWTPLAAHHVSPYMQTTFGGRRITHETLDTALRKELLDEWDNGGGTLSHYPKRSDYSVELSRYGPALAFGSGFDWVVTRAFAWRMVNVEYSHAWLGNADLIQAQNSLRITTGAVLRIGTW
jgi:hypothetical protein